MAKNELIYSAVAEALHSENTAEEILIDVSTAFESHFIGQSEEREPDTAQILAALGECRKLEGYLTAFLAGSARPNSEDEHADLPTRLNALARQVIARSPEGAPNWITSLAQQLSTLGDDARENYERLLPPEGETPTAAQGVALARFLRSRLRDSGSHARVARGTGILLPEGFLHVVFDDGYEGGIDRDGQVST